MRRTLILVGVLAMALAGCGGSSATASPSSSGGASASAAGQSQAASASLEPGASSPAQSTPPDVTEPPATSTSTAICDGISLRKQPSSTSPRLKTISSGTAVHVVATVQGTAYTAGSCGTSGDTWLKIDKVGGKTAKAAYGVTYVYAAAGFFQ
jgi:ABC-type Fe3+-hydroxamate transport system substrate-binding protein